MLLTAQAVVRVSGRKRCDRLGVFLERSQRPKMARTPSFAWLLAGVRVAREAASTLFICRQTRLWAAERQIPFGYSWRRAPVRRRCAWSQRAVFRATHYDAQRCNLTCGAERIGPLVGRVASLQFGRQSIWGGSHSKAVQRWMALGWMTATRIYAATRAPRPGAR